MRKLNYYPYFLLLLALIVGCSDNEDTPITPPSGNVTSSLTIEAGSEGTITGSFSDDIGIATITISNSDLNLDQSIDAGGGTSYSLSATLAIDANTSAGVYDVLVTVVNTGNVSADFTVSLTVTEPCPAQSFNEGLAEAAVDFTEANEDYNFDDYSATFSDIAIAINDDCNVLTLTGDFLDWQSTIDESFTPELNLTIVPGVNGPTSGNLTFEEEIMGDMADGFRYRMAPSDTEGTYDELTGTITMKFYIEYDIDGEWVYWYTTTMTLSLQ